MFDTEWFFQQLDQRVEPLRYVMEEIRDRMDLMLKFQLVELPRVGGDVVSIAPEAVGSMYARRSFPNDPEGTWITMRGGRNDEFFIALPYEETKKRLGMVS